VLYKVHKEGAKYILDAGRAHGISTGAELAIYQEQDTQRQESLLGTLIVKEVDPFNTVLHLPDGASELVLSGTGYALQTRAGEEEDLRLHIEQHDLLRPIFEAFSREMLRTDPSLWKVQLVEKDKAELSLVLDNNMVVFDILNPQVTQFGLTRHPFHVEPTYDAVFPIIRAAAHYHWHLRRSNTTKVLQNHVDVEFRKVKDSGYDEEFNPIIKPVGDNLNVDGIVNLVIDDPDDDYGIKIINRSPIDLHASLFFFDNSDLSISKCSPKQRIKNTDPAVDNSILLPAAHSLECIGCAFGQDDGQRPGVTHHWLWCWRQRATQLFYEGWARR
jgi:hypothetical protein